MSSATPHALHPIRVWDLPTRLFHLALGLGVLGMGTTGWLDLMDWHFRLGFIMAALLLFRLIWGVVGGHWSRFRNFLFGPTMLLAYLRGRADASVETGHSPTGALSVFSLLFFIALQVLSGACTDNEVDAAGPLVSHVSGAWVGRASFYHTTVGPWVLAALLLLHVAAIGLYTRVRHRSLIRPMITGDKQLEVTTPASRDGWPQRLTAGAVLVLSLAVIWRLLVWMEH